jgi:hypothetical protein
MPVLKSPGQILKVWRKSTATYLDLNDLLGQNDKK